mmetsp:Transcript_38345/g.28235  ORF Transcript_38345/g.28235 Transcript_38345/m.28235 type:complete len:90 (+) Transcript_38345:85-354(+)
MQSGTRQNGTKQMTHIDKQQHHCIPVVSSLISVRRVASQRGQYACALVRVPTKFLEGRLYSFSLELSAFSKLERSTVKISDWMVFGEID